MQTLVDGFRKIVRYHRWIQRLGIILALLLIVLAFLAMVQQRRGSLNIWTEYIIYGHINFRLLL